MAFFHPKTLLDKTYEIGIILKGFDGVLEIIGGTMLWLLKPETIERWTQSLTQDTLARDPDNFIATHLFRYGHELAHAHVGLAILFLLSHGIVKVALVTALLLQKMWAYPWAIFLLFLFLIYQAYLLITQPSIWMAILTVLDVVIIWLVWREWKEVLRRRAEKHSKKLDKPTET